MANQPTIGILVTNTDRSDFAKRHDADGVKFTNLMRSVRPDWNYKVYDCTQEEFPTVVDECDGYVMGGSPASANDDEPWIEALFNLICQFDAAQTPLVGCCFGHQAIAKALGGKVDKNPRGWGFGVSSTNISRVENWMVPPRSSLRLFAAHNEQVSILPPNAVVLGGDDFCPIGAFRIGEHFMTTQYHPEMTKMFFVGLTHAFEDYIGSAVSTHARQQADAETDGKLFAQWMANFLEMRRR